MFDLLSNVRVRAVEGPADIAVAILAGGLGTRLRPVLADRPKVMAEVAGRPFLSYWFDRLEQQGFRDVVLCTGFLAEQIHDFFGSNYGNLRLRYSREPAPLGTAGALRHALDQLDSECLLVLNGDSWCDAPLANFWQNHRARRCGASLVLTRVEDTSRFGWVKVNWHGRVQEFREKHPFAGTGWINAGIYLMDRKWIEALPAHQNLSLERDVLPQWIPQEIYSFPSTGRFIDIGTPASLAQAERFFAEIEPTPLAVYRGERLGFLEMTPHA
ncbi:MAG: nucleotidyltransferase family protein [Verrucomicrobiota bacterium]|jgi:NDP-sugar pyrophosphorylase family protein